jgi:hypothetical protein
MRQVATQIRRLAQWHEIDASRFLIDASSSGRDLPMEKNADTIELMVAALRSVGILTTATATSLLERYRVEKDARICASSSADAAIGGEPAEGPTTN